MIAIKWSNIVAVLFAINYQSVNIIHICPNMRLLLHICKSAQLSKIHKMDKHDDNFSIVVNMKHVKKSDKKQRNVSKIQNKCRKLANVVTNYPKLSKVEDDEKWQKWRKAGKVVKEMTSV